MADQIETVFLRGQSIHTVQVRYRPAMQPQKHDMLIAQTYNDEVNISDKSSLKKC